MEIVEGIRERKSVRGFKPDQVPRKVLEEILTVAARSPSAMNAQPWETTVITGKTLDAIRQGNVELLTSKVKTHPDIWRKPCEGVYRERQIGLAVQLFQLMDVARDDKAKRAWWLQRGFRFFDAPAAIIISTDVSMIEVQALFDLGIYCQSICLAAMAYGLGTCIEDQGVKYPEVIRKYTGIPTSKLIINSIAIGYPDWAFPANKIVSVREPVQNNVAWFD